MPCCSDCFAGGGGRWRCSGSRMAAPSSGETRLFTPLGISFRFLFSSLSSLFPFYTPYSSSLKFPPLFQTSPFFSLPPFQFQKSPLPSKKILLSSVFFRFPPHVLLCWVLFIEPSEWGFLPLRMGAGQAAAGRPLGATVEVRLQRHGASGRGTVSKRHCSNSFFFFIIIIIIIYIFLFVGTQK